MGSTTSLFSSLEFTMLCTSYRKKPTEYVSRIYFRIISSVQLYNCLDTPYGPLKSAVVYPRLIPLIFYMEFSTDINTLECANAVIALNLLLLILWLVQTMPSALFKFKHL